MTLRSFRVLVLPLAVALAGCASTPPQATVQVYTAPPQVPAGTTYRYDRLPSQAAQPGQAEMEAAADALLARSGLRRSDAAPRLSVQLAATQDQVSSGSIFGGPSVGLGIGLGGGSSGVGIGLGVPLGGGARVRASQRVDVQMRDVASGQVVYQSQASSGGDASPAALVAAALRDFPNSPPGARQVPLGLPTR